MRTVKQAGLHRPAVAVYALLLICGCGAPAPGNGVPPTGDPDPQAQNESTVPIATDPTSAGPISTVALINEELPSEILDRLQPWTGDFDAMVERRFVRVLVTPNRTAYFLDGARQRGVSYELVKLLEDKINKDLMRIIKEARNGAILARTSEDLANHLVEALAADDEE